MYQYLRLQILLTLIVFGLIITRASDFAWFESETPTRSTVDVQPKGWGNVNFLSESKWLNIDITADKQTKDGAAILEYEFNLPSAGNYEIWDRAGLVSLRQPFQWRIDTGEWQDITGTESTVDVMRIEFFCEVAWLKLSAVDLTTGKHTLQIRAKNTKNADGTFTAANLKFTSDAFCIYKGQFHPNSKFKPGSDWMNDTDKKAANNIYTILPAKIAGERAITPLAGLWQIARFDENKTEDRTEGIKAIPDAKELFWMNVNVPGDKYTTKPELNMCHRFIYRTRVNIPANAAGKSFILRFPSNNMISTVFVNGINCGFTRAMLANWDCDITKAIKPGQINEIWVGIKDTYYANPKIEPVNNYIPLENWKAQWMTENFDFPVAGHAESGILKTPSLIITGPVYLNDVFAIPSVKNKQLTLETTITNKTNHDISVTLNNEITLLSGNKAEKIFAPVQITVPAGQTQTIKPTETWGNPKLWWLDDPKQYNIITTVMIDGKVADSLKTKFGFREWEWSGTDFKLNGIIWHGRADLFANMTSNPLDISKMKAHGQSMARLWGDSKEVSPDMLDMYDANGMPVRRTGIFDGQGGQYGNFLGGAESLFAHWREQLDAWVKEERNHPSIFIWSIENEITYINVRNWGHTKRVDPLMRDNGLSVMKIDPTRPVMVDGGRALIDNSLPVYGCHYEETSQRDYPDEAYTLDKTLTGKYTWQIWPMDRKKPILMGESFFARGFAPAWYAGVSGESAFTGRTEAAKGVGIFTKMLSEGYRWSGVNYHYWHGDESSIYYNSWQPVALLSRQWNWTFASNAKIERTLRLFNDTRYNDPITTSWSILSNGKKIATDSKIITVGAGLATDWPVIVTIPKVAKRTAMQFVLTCKRNGKEVFRDVKDMVVIAPDSAARPKLAKDDLLVLDPNGTVKSRLLKRGIAFTEITGFDTLPLKAKIVIVGKDALTLRQSTDPKWMTLAANGTRVIVLDQAFPLRNMAIPADFTITDYVGRIAFIENIDHPIFNGLGQQDFFTWSKDHIVYRNVYKKASHGASSLVQCDEELACTALAASPVNDGIILTCQLVVGAKLDTDPVAQRLFDNMLNYAATYVPVRKQTATAISPASPTGKMLTESGLVYKTTTEVVDAINDPKIDIVIAEASAANLAKLTAAQLKVKAFTQRGGYLMLMGLDANGLADFNKLVGVNHMIRPFEMERVTLPAVSDPLLSGITTRDIVMESGQTINQWSGDRFMADDVFTSVVDVDDIAPFSTVPAGTYFNYNDSKPGWDHWPRNMFNNFTSVDSWKYAFTVKTSDQKCAKWTMTFPQEQEITEVKILFTPYFNQIRKVNLYFDNDPTPATFIIGQNWKDLQTLTFDKPRKAKVVTVELPDFLNSPNGIYGIDNMWMYAKRPEGFNVRVKPLLNIGALVKYPMGTGGVVLNNLRIQTTETNPINAQKKRNIISTFLRNMGAQFAGGKTIVAGANLNYTPIPLDSKCNAFLTKDKGWPDNRDFSALPKGDITLTGVSYNIRDFKTSPLPACIMLTGMGSAQGLPHAVTAIPIGKKTDALFFLHTAKIFKNWIAPQKGDQTPPPVIFKYVVHYDDGETVEIPIRYDLSVGNWVSNNPQGNKECAIAWAAPYANSNEQAVVYQYMWTNPRPDVGVATIDLTYNDGANHAIPVLMAITAATTIK